MMVEQLTNFGRTTITGAINDTTTSVTVADGSVFPATGDFRLNCEDELMLCTARSGNDLTVVRGIESTTAASHSAVKPITQVVTAGAVVQLIDDRTSTQKLWAYQNFK